MAPQIGCYAASRDRADLRRNVLDDRHERKAEQQAPRQAITEFGADLAVCPDAARIVVGSAGDETRPELGQEASASLVGQHTLPLTAVQLSCSRVPLNPCATTYHSLESLRL